MAEHLVEVDNVTKVFHTYHFFEYDEDEGKRYVYRRRDVDAARHVSFRIKRGEIFGLLGPNGAGKTTTVKMISGLVRPTAGRVNVAGLNVERKRSKVLRKVGVVLEGTRTCIWPLTPLENLAYFGNLKDVRGKVLKSRSRELLKFIGLKEKMNVQVRKLSRGQKQKLAICIALIADPPIVLLDEPTTGLDVQSSRAIKDKIREMTREHGKSVLVTTHDMYVAQEICDRIGIIDKGRLITCKPTEELLEYFSEQTYVILLDKFPNEETFAGVPGVLKHEVRVEDGQHVLEMRVSLKPEERSEALYTVVERLGRQGLQIWSMSHQKQTLENIFLELTSNSSKDGEV